MKRYAFIFSVLVFFSAYSQEIQDRYHFKINKKVYRFSTFFEIDSEDAPRGNVKKSVFRLRTNYDLSDVHGWQATGIVRVLSLGLFYDWAKEIDVYDTQWNYIGMIDGQMMTTAAARYSIYNKQDQLVGIALLDQNCTGFTIIHPSSEAYTIARLKRNFVADTVDDWKVIVYEGHHIDPRILRILAAFVVDYQDSFKKDL